MNQKNLIIYYLLLLVVLCSWSDPANSPNMFLRLAYLAAMILPAYIYQPNLLPQIIICFTGISAYGYAASYLPTDNYNYTYILLALSILPFKNKKNHIKIPAILVIFALYTLVIDITNGERLEFINYASFAAIFTLYFVSKDEKYNNLYYYAFIIITFVLCFFFFTIGDQFIVDSRGQDRIMWQDPNYMGCVAGVGIICAYYMLVKNIYRSKWIRYLLLATVCLGAVMILMNASRGAALCVASGIIVVTMYSKISLKKRIIIVALVVIGIVLMYRFGLFSALEQRMMSDEDGTGSGRTNIWALKLLLFSEEPTYKLFTGLGHRGGFMLGYLGGYGFHNDFVAFFVGYGIIGFCLFVCMLLYPLFLVRKNKENKAIVTALTVYLLLCCMTLEPFNAGRLTYFYIYIFIFILAKQQSPSLTRK